MWRCSQEVVFIHKKEDCCIHLTYFTLRQTRACDVTVLAPFHQHSNRLAIFGALLSNALNVKGFVTLPVTVGPQEVNHKTKERYARCI